MNTLANGSFLGEEATSPNAGITPDIIPEARSSRSGVSVRYAPLPDGSKKWFLFRVSYGREMQAADLLIEQGVYAYFPQRYEMVEREGKRKRVLKSLLPNLLFAYLSPEEAELFTKGPSRQDITADTLSERKASAAFSLSLLLSYYYNHFATNERGNNPPLVIPAKEMANFILATQTHSQHLKQVIMEKCRFLDDKQVVVVEGVYKGVRGRVARVAGQQCIVVSLANGTFNVSTDYIPKHFIRVIDE